MHALNVLHDVLGDAASGKAGELHEAMRMIEAEGRGVVVLIREPSPQTLSEAVRQKLGEQPAAAASCVTTGLVRRSSWTWACAIWSCSPTPRRMSWAWTAMVCASSASVPSMYREGTTRMDDKPHILIIEARFYDDIVDELKRGAVAALEAAGVTYESLAVPGAFEVPAAIKMAIRSHDFYSGQRRFDGYVTLGCVIRGETSHYDYVCNESARKLQDLACQYTLALGYGILTCENAEQAWARASVEGKDKGGDVARACLRMLEIKRQFHLFPRE